MPPHVKTLIESLEVEENLGPYKKHATREIQIETMSARVRDLGIKTFIISFRKEGSNFRIKLFYCIAF